MVFSHRRSKREAISFWPPVTRPEIIRLLASIQLGVPPQLQTPKGWGGSPAMCICVCVYVFWHMCIWVCMWRSEFSVQEWVFAFNHVTSQGLNSDCLAWRQAPLPAELSSQPMGTVWHRVTEFSFDFSACVLNRILFTCIMKKIGKLNTFSHWLETKNVFIVGVIKKSFAFEFSFRVEISWTILCESREKRGGFASQHGLKDL